MRNLWISIITLILLSDLLGCTADDEFAQKQQWLKQNYPDRAQSVKQLPAPPSQFTKQILAGKIVNGMRLEEVYIATDAHPYGSKPVDRVLWCGEQKVSQCDSKCRECNAIVLTKKIAILLSGKPNFVRVTTHRPRGKKEPAHLYDVHFSLAKHTFYVMGKRAQKQIKSQE